MLKSTEFVNHVTTIVSNVNKLQINVQYVLVIELPMQHPNIVYAQIRPLKQLLEKLNVHHVIGDVQDVTLLLKIVSNVLQEEMEYQIVNVNMELPIVEPLPQQLIVNLVLTTVKVVVTLQMIVKYVLIQESTLLNVFAHQDYTKNKTLLVDLVIIPAQNVDIPQTSVQSVKEIEN